LKQNSKSAAKKALPKTAVKQAPSKAATKKFATQTKANVVKKAPSSEPDQLDAET
jgi:hypothetical protein